LIFGLGGKKKSVRKAKPAKKSAGKRKAFGGYAISFAGRKETLEQLFGKKPIGPSVMTKVLWKFVKAKRLGKKD
jgi:hypothetical protein